MKQRKLKLLKGLWEYLSYYNKFSPFPIYDTEYVSTIKEKLDEMTDENINYDDLPTASCKYCDSLGIKQDELDNDICLRCGSINEINIFKTYYEYEQYLKNKKDAESN